MKSKKKTTQNTKKDKIHIGYFYYDLLNLYGDSGNVTILEHHLREQGFAVSVDRLTVDEPKKITDYDLIYMGSGTERALLLALMDLRKYKTPLSYAIEHGTFILATGNSFELFGKEIRMGRKVYAGLGLLDFSSEYGARIVHDLCLPYSGSTFGNTAGETPTSRPLGTANTLVGFENHPGSVVELKEKPFVRIDDRTEGVIKNNFLGTYTIGPLLVRNPFLCRELVQNLIHAKYPQFSMKEADYTLEEQAYNASLKFMKEAHLS